MTMDVKEEQEKALDSIRRNSESDSNEIDESDLQPEKQPEPRIRMCLGMQTILSHPKYRMRIERSTPCKKSPSTAKRWLLS
jgi:hypothetical protein